MLKGICIFLLAGCRYVRVVAIIPSEQEDLVVLLVSEQIQQVVSRLDSGGKGILPHRGLLVWGVVGGQVALDCADNGGIADISIIGISPYYQCRRNVGKVESADCSRALDAAVPGSAHVVGIGMCMLLPK